VQSSSTSHASPVGAGKTVHATSARAKQSISPSPGAQADMQ
jgi:hypothetical protein